MNINTEIKTNFRFIHNNKAKEFMKEIKKINGIEVRRTPQPEDKLNYTQILCSYPIQYAKRIREELDKLSEKYKKH